MEQSLAAHIEQTPGVRGGKPRISGTRICVSDVVLWTEQGKSPDEIVTDFPQLTLANVYAALAYYHDHRETVDRQIAQADSFAEKLRGENPSLLSKNKTNRDGG